MATNISITSKSKFGGGTHFDYPIIDGNQYINQTNGNSVFTGNLGQFGIAAGVITTAQDVTALDISFSVTGGNGAGKLCKLCVYKSIDGANWTIVCNSPDLDCSTTGLKTWSSANIPLLKDTFYVVAPFANNTLIQVLTCNNATYPCMVPTFNNPGNTPSNGISFTAGSYALPGSIATSITQISNLATLWFKLNKL
jgi:hypothetical protein